MENQENANLSEFKQHYGHNLRRGLRRRRETGDRRRETGEGRQEKGDRRRETGEGRQEKGEGRRAQR
jgi:hypothetical protein